MSRNTVISVLCEVDENEIVGSLSWMTFDTDPNTKTQWLKQHPWVGEMVQWVKVFAPNLNIKKKAAAMFFRGLEVCPACMKPQVQASP